MELKRSNISKFLNDKYKNSNYYKKFIKTIRPCTWSKNPEDDILEIVIDDLDHIKFLKMLYEQIKENYNAFSPNQSWKPSFMNLMMSVCLKNNFRDNDIHKNKFLHNVASFYQKIYMYFYDEGNKNEEICKEEIDFVLPLLDDFFGKIWKE